MTLDLVHDGKLDREATAAALRQFLEKMMATSGLQLLVKVSLAGDPASNAIELDSSTEIIADLDGKDREILLERGGEVLKALEHLAFRALHLDPAYHERIHIDCAGYRALRFEELRMTARMAADRVQTSRQPFRMNPMSSRERRIVHLALKEMPGVRTESSGVGEHRQVVILPMDEKTHK